MTTLTLTFSVTFLVAANRFTIAKNGSGYASFPAHRTDNVERSIRQLVESGETVQLMVQHEDGTIETVENF